LREDYKAAAEAEHVKAEAEKEVERAAPAEKATHWAAQMDKALAYQMDVERNTAGCERQAGRRADTEHRIERRMTVRRQEAAIRAAMAAIEAAGVGGNGNGGALL
jgi:hypothetical protein